MKLVLVCALIAGVVAAKEAVADVRYETGSSLAQKCSGGAADCAGDLKQVAALVAPALNLVCLPANISVNDMALIFKAYAKAHPDLLWHAASTLVTQALFEAFPCDETPTRVVQ